MDQCTHCTMRGNLNGCLATKCNQHESWMIGELKYVMASLVRRCEDELADPEDVVELLEARAVLTPNDREHRRQKPQSTRRVDTMRKETTMLGINR